MTVNFFWPLEAVEDAEVTTSEALKQLLLSAGSKFSLLEPGLHCPPLLAEDKTEVVGEGAIILFSEVARSEAVPDVGRVGRLDVFVAVVTVELVLAADVDTVCGDVCCNTKVWHFLNALYHATNKTEHSFHH